MAQGLLPMTMITLGGHVIVLEKETVATEPPAELGTHVSLTSTTMIEG